MIIPSSRRCVAIALAALAVIPAAPVVVLDTAAGVLQQTRVCDLDVVALSRMQMFETHMRFYERPEKLIAPLGKGG